MGTVAPLFRNSALRFWERDIPRLLELATARAGCDAPVPVELVNYPARSRAERERRAQS